MCGGALNNQADIKIVTNYSIETDSKCFGFSVISSVMIPKMDHYVNGELDYTNPNVIYSESTYKGISELHNNGQTMYQNNISAREIKVPENFYPCELVPNAVSIESSYLKIKGNINSIESIKVLDTPVSIAAHYKSYGDKNEEPEQSTILDLIDYFNVNAKYVKY